MNELRDMSTMLFIINLITMIAVVLVIGCAPIITRKSLLFGVRIPEEATQNTETLKLKKNYTNKMVILGIATLVLLVTQYLLFPDISLLAMLYLPLLVMAAQFLTYVSAWKKATALKAKNNWSVPMTATVDTTSAVQREQIWTFSKWWYALSALIIIAVAALSLVKYPSLPAQIVTHWGLDMKPDAWADKNFWTVLMMPITALIMVVVLMLGNIMIYRMKLQVSAEHPAISYAQHRIYRRMMSEALGILTLAMTVFFGLLQLMTIDILAPTKTMMIGSTIIMILASCIPFTYVYFKAGQGGCKLHPVINAEDVKGNTISYQKSAKFNRGDDKFWKLGMFYYNEDDPAMLVEDRFGTNSGFNYAKAASKVVTAGLIIMIVVVYIGTTIMFIKTWL
jgi:Predicted membrane protein